LSAATAAWLGGLAAVVVLLVADAASSALAALVPSDWAPAALGVSWVAVVGGATAAIGRTLDRLEGRRP
jgi:hypothetical protein